MTDLHHWSVGRHSDWFGHSVRMHERCNNTRITTIASKPKAKRATKSEKLTLKINVLKIDKPLKRYIRAVTQFNVLMYFQQKKRTPQEPGSGYREQKRMTPGVRAVLANVFL